MAIWKNEFFSDGEVPGEFKLGQNYPNPFNPVTTIRYELPADTHVDLRVYDVLGREARILVDGEKLSGSYSVEFDASDLASGMYFYKITAGQFSDVKKMLIMK